MASEVQADKAEIQTKEDETISIELPAPQGWAKKFIPRKGASGTPRRNEIVFIAPTGEEIKSKRQLDHYLKSHPGGPAASEFDWGTGDTPRRSARLSTKSKATDTPESVSSRKRQKKSGTKKEDEKKDGTDEEAGSAEDEAAAGKSEDGEDVEMKDAEVAGDLSKEEKAEKAADSTEPSVKNIEGKSDEGQVTEAARASSLDGQEAQVEEPASGKGEEQPEENKLETGDKQTEAEVPQQTVPSGGEEQPEEKKPESGSDADLLMKNNATEEPGETKEDHREKVAEPLVTEEKKPEAGTDAELPKATNNTTERQAGKTEEPGEKPTESLVPEEKKPETGSDTELPKETIHATEEQPGETKVAGEKPAESLGQPDVLVSPVNTSTEKDVNETTPTNAGETEAKQGHENPEEKVSSEVVGVDTNGTKENQETTMHTKNQPANHDGTPDGTAHEPSAAPPVSC